MSTDTHPFADPNQLRAAFADGLQRMLAEDPGMGAFILVLANARSEPGQFDDLEAALTSRYRELADRCRHQLVQGEPSSAPPDDLLVLLKLMALDMEQLPALQQRLAGPWRVQFNWLRSLRPERAGAEAITQLQRPFNPEGFHFNKPFLASETFWRGDFLGRSTNLLYNKFPFMPLHGLWVPDAAREWPQYLQAELHHYIWDCCNQLHPRIPGVGLGYNSLGAGASINHLHFQLFVEPDLPIEADIWSHNGGKRAYPLPCERFIDPALAWRAIEQCHAQNIAYNILYRGAEMFLIPRRFQGQFQKQPWLSALGWSELCGRFALFNQDNYGQLEAPKIEQQLRALAL